MGKYAEILKEYNFILSDQEIKTEIQKIQSESKASKEIFKSLFGCIDLTSLNTTDTNAEIEKMVEKLNTFKQQFNDMPNVAGICVYPAFVETVKKNLTETGVDIVSVAGGFPSSQTFPEIKIAETALAVADGAQEIDVVISVGKFLEGNYDGVGEELEEIKQACRNAKLKVILETGALKSASDIYKAGIIAMYAGADFIKTSTGKVQVNATPEAAYVMCKSISDFYQKTNTKVGFKAAGGIAASNDALIYYGIVEKLLGKDSLNGHFFRIGASRLANDLLSNIYEKTIKFF